MDLANRASAEARVEREMGRLSERHRKELVRLLGNPPDPANVPAEFWERVERERRDELLLLLLLLFLLSARQHGATDKQAASAAAEQFARARAGKLSRDFVSITREKLDARRLAWEDARRKAAEAGEPDPIGVEDAREAGRDIFAPSRDEAVAITEVTSATSAGGEWAVKQAGEASDDDLWITEADGKVCEICSPLHRTKRGRWSGKFPEGPPAHPRCRCYLEYAATPAAVSAGAT